MKEIDKIRKLVDSVDEDILRLLVRRKGLVKEIGIIKSKANLPVLDKKRETELINNLKKKFPKLDEDYIEEIYKIILEQSKKDETKQTNQKD